MLNSAWRVKDLLSFIDPYHYFGGIISKDGGSSEDVKIWLAKAQGVFSKKVFFTKMFGRIGR